LRGSGDQRVVAVLVAVLYMSPTLAPRLRNA